MKTEFHSGQKVLLWALYEGDVSPDSGIPWSKELREIETVDGNKIMLKDGFGENRWGPLTIDEYGVPRTRKSMYSVWIDRMTDLEISIAECVKTMREEV